VFLYFQRSFVPAILGTAEELFDAIHLPQGKRNRLLVLLCLCQCQDGCLFVTNELAKGLEELVFEVGSHVVRHHLHVLAFQSVSLVRLEGAFLGQHHASQHTLIPLNVSNEAGYSINSIIVLLKPLCYSRHENCLHALLYEQAQPLVVLDYLKILLIDYKLKQRLGIIRQALQACEDVQGLTGMGQRLLLFFISRN